MQYKKEKEKGLCGAIKIHRRGISKKRKGTRSEKKYFVFTKKSTIERISERSAEHLQVPAVASFVPVLARTGHTSTGGCGFHIRSFVVPSIDRLSHLRLP